MSKEDYLLIIQGLLLIKNDDLGNPNQIQNLINHFDKLYQE